MILAAEAEAAGSTITWVQIVGLVSIVVAVATYLASQRDRRRIYAAAVYVVVDKFAAYYHQPTDALAFADARSPERPLRTAWFTEPIALCRIVSGLSDLADHPFGPHGS